VGKGYRTEDEAGRVNPGSATVYKIRDADGRLVAEHVREDKPDGDKVVRWRLPDGTWSLNGTRLEQLPLYGSEQVSTWDEDDLIVVAEGEKPCDALARTDFFYALGTVCGSASVPGKESLEVLRGRRVVLWPDNDEAGRKHMERIAERLHSIAAEVLIYTWDEAPEKGDAADHPIVKARDRKALDRLLTDLESAPRWKPEKPPNGHVPEIEDVVASSIETKPVEWLWKGRIPKGKLTMLDGDPDLGKSVVTMDIAARVSTGRGFSDGWPCEAGNVLILNLEDASEDTIVPRLKAHGADLGRIFILPATVPGGNGDPKLLELPRDLLMVENKVIQREAVLLILDPLQTILEGDVNKDQDARKALTPVADMADRTGIAVVGVRHLNKSTGLKAIQRGSGNMGLIGVARAGSFFAEHPDDEKLRVMAPHKSNLAEKPPSLCYRTVPWAIDPEIPRVEWMGATSHNANSLAAGNLSPHEKSVLDEAIEFLRDELADGPMWAKQVFKDARDAGVAEITLRRAKTALRVKSERQGTEGWAWRLPEDDHPPLGGDGEGDHSPTHDKDDQDDRLRRSDKGAPKNTAFIKEDDHGDQDDHDHAHADDHDHDHLPPGAEGLIRAVFEETNGATLNLPHYRRGRTTLTILTTSVLGVLGREWGKMGADERRSWEQAVERIVEDKLHASVPE
jgi:hypothetical protein